MGHFTLLMNGSIVNLRPLLTKKKKKEPIELTMWPVQIGLKGTKLVYPEQLDLSISHLPVSHQKMTQAANTFSGDTRLLAVFGPFGFNSKKFNGNFIHVILLLKFIKIKQWNF